MAALNYFYENKQTDGGGGGWYWCRSSGLMSVCLKCCPTNLQWWCLSNSCQVYNSELTCQKQCCETKCWLVAIFCLRAWVHFKCVILKILFAELWQSLAKNDSCCNSGFVGSQSKPTIWRCCPLLLFTSSGFLNIFRRRHNLVIYSLALESRLMKTLQGSAL